MTNNPYSHHAEIAKRYTGWGVFCRECSNEQQDYIFCETLERLQFPRQLSEDPAHAAHTEEDTISVLHRMTAKFNRALDIIEDLLAVCPPDDPISHTARDFIKDLR